jgi:hypothetical protein
MTLPFHASVLFVPCNMLIALTALEGLEAEWNRRAEGEAHPPGDPGMAQGTSRLYLRAAVTTGLSGGPLGVCRRKRSYRDIGC